MHLNQLRRETSQGERIHYDISCVYMYNALVTLNKISLVSIVFGSQQSYSSLFCETSAKDGSNIIEAVLHLAR